MLIGGYDANPWCLANRTEDNLETAKEYWKYHNAYPKRIAFKNRQIISFLRK